MKDLGASEEEVLTELRKQRQERLKAPEESLERVHRIQTHGLQPETWGKITEMLFGLAGLQEGVTHTPYHGVVEHSGTPYNLHLNQKVVFDCSLVSYRSFRSHMLHMQHNKKTCFCCHLLGSSLVVRVSVG